MIFSVVLGLFAAVNTAPSGPPPPPGLEIVNCQVQGCGFKDYEGQWTVTSISPSLQQSCDTLKYTVLHEKTNQLQLQFYESCMKQKLVYSTDGYPKHKEKTSLLYFDVKAQHKIGQNLVPYPSTITMVKLWKIGGVVVAASVLQPLIHAETLTPETYYTLWLNQQARLTPQVIQQLQAAHDVWEFVDCKKKECTPQDYLGLWDVVNISPSLKSQCERLTYAVITNNPQTKQLKFSETCQKTSTTLEMAGVPNASNGGLLHLNSGNTQWLGGMMYYWKKNGVVVAASVQLRLLHATTESFRPLWFKRGMLTDTEKDRMMLQHSMWGKVKQ